MAELVIMPRADYVDICNAVRDKADIEGSLVSGQIADIVESIETSIIYDADIGDYISGELIELEIPDDIYLIRNYCFYRMSNLERISIPDSIYRIGVEAFRECPVLASITIPSGTKDITYRAFAYCPSLANVTFEGMPVSIANDVFKGSSVQNIYVPWREGAVDNAPWGAIEATIHYNSEVT